MISWAVVGHEARLVQATDLARTLGAVVVMDGGSGSIGADANHLRAWDATSTMDADWCGVMEDDALLVAGFNEQAEQALAVAPAKVVSCYLGRGKPRRWQPRIPDALAHADAEHACWITSNYMLHGVAVVMRTELREDWLDWAPLHHRIPIDERLGAWCRLRRHTIAYTVPSLVDHADGPTLINHPDGRPRDMPRIAWRTGTRDTWTAKAVSM